MLVDEACFEALFGYGGGGDASFPFGGDKEGGVVEVVEEGAVGGVGGDEVGEGEAGGGDVEGGICHFGGFGYGISLGEGRVRFIYAMGTAFLGTWRIGAVPCERCLGYGSCCLCGLLS